MLLKRFRKATLALLCSVACLQPLNANAGRNCEERPADATKTQQAIRLATQVRDLLELSDAKVALLARIGSDQSKRGVRYTHVGYLLRNHPAGSWTVVHELNTCGTGTSDLFDEGLANFYMDDLFELETQIIIPGRTIQEKLAQALLGPAKRSLHSPSYSSIANPWDVKHQNSNGWVLEVYAASLGNLRSRTEAQRWLQENGYQPSRIRIGASERAGARLFTPNIRFGDHPDSAWQNQTYDVNTGDSVMTFVGRLDPEARLITQRLDARPIVERTAPQIPTKSTDPQLAHATPSALTPALPATTSATPPPQTRGQLLQSMQGLIIPYACRPEGYLSQCRQLDRPNCERQVSDAILRCFATVSDHELTSGSEQAAMQKMQEIGYCAVETVDTSNAASGKRAQTTNGTPCPSVRNFQQATKR